MPTITIRQEALRRYLKGDPSDEELARAITMIGTDMDSFDEEITTEVFPNRPDLLSAPGLARALDHFLGYVEEPVEYTAEKGGEDAVVTVEKSVAGVRPHTRCAIVSGLSLSDEGIKEIVDIQEKLHITFGRRRKKVAIGVYPLERITLPITYRAERPSDIVFRPLEADREMTAAELLEEHPTGKAYAHLLEGEKLFPVFRDADGKVLSVPPIINSHDVGKVTEETSSVFVECSGHDPLALEQALNMILCALADMGGEISMMEIRYADWHVLSPDLSWQRMEIDREYVARRAGIPEEALEESLRRLGVFLEGGSLRIPPYRTDYLHQVDAVEDAAIGYGYDEIPSTVPEAYTAGSLSKEQVLLEAVRETLVGFGMQEVRNYYISAEGVPLANPLTKEYSALRTELLPQLLDTLQRNVNNSYPQLLFEVGPVFSEDGSAETGVSERLAVAGVICAEDADYTRARQIVEALAHAMRWEISFREGDDAAFIPGRSAGTGEDLPGRAGEVHPELLASRGVQLPVAAFEILLPQ